MKKELIILFLLGIFLILPIISAQEQIETYGQTGVHAGNCDTATEHDPHTP